MNYFKFPADAAFYRLFYESTQTDFTALVVAARTIAELDQRTKKLEVSGGSASCTILNDDDMCSAIPKDVAVNPVIAVTVNGAELMVPRGATVGSSIRLPREQQPAVLERLAVSRPWNGRLVPVTFDRTDPSILGVILKGGEVISW